jgi:hypothetical protein
MGRHERLTKRITKGQADEMAKHQNVLAMKERKHLPFFAFHLII